LVLGLDQFPFGRDKAFRGQDDAAGSGSTAGLINRFLYLGVELLLKRTQLLKFVQTDAIIVSAFEQVFDQEGERLAAQVGHIVVETPGGIAFEVADEYGCGGRVGDIFKEKGGGVTGTPGGLPFRPHWRTDVAAQDEQVNVGSGDCHRVELFMRAGRLFDAPGQRCGNFDDGLAQRFG